MNEVEAYYDKVDQLEAAMVHLEETECPLIHRFTPGMYIREVFIPGGTLVTSKIHKTEHPFVLSKGRVSILIDGEIQVLEAPFCGVTKPGTRRVVYAHEDTVWLTFHATDKKTPEEVEDEIIEKRENKLLIKNK